ncbi:hypothetical protein GCM10009602_26780 [Nocardiopsis tropica]
MRTGERPRALDRSAHARGAPANPGGALDLNESRGSNISRDTPTEEKSAHMILVTGATGNIGRVLLRELAERGAGRLRGSTGAATAPDRWTRARRSC